MTNEKTEAIEWAEHLLTGRRIGGKDNCRKLKILIEMAKEKDEKIDSDAYNIDGGNIEITMMPRRN